jgi:Bardet-Biedl syndrome 5 protein
VEDTKGNNGERGSLMVTNLRFVWHHEKHNRINLSIGLGCVVSISIHKVDSKLLGHTQALFVMTKFGESRFEFIFTYLVRGSPRLFSTCQAVHRAFETSRMFRDVKVQLIINFKYNSAISLNNNFLHVNSCAGRSSGTRS